MPGTYGCTMKVCVHNTLTGSFQKLYTVDYIRYLTVNHINVCNTAKTKSTVSVCVVKRGETPSAVNALMWDRSVDANSFVEYFSGGIVGPSESLVALASVPNTVAIRVCGECN